MSELNLLLVHADDHSEVGSADASGASSGAVTPDGAGPEYLWDEGGDPNDLPLQRWGVVAPDGARGDRLLEVIAPLLRHREAQQGAPVKVYRAPEKLSPGDAARWRKQVFETGADLNVDLPRYQLLLGDLHELPLSLQQVLSTDGFVGRLAFGQDEAYAAYVDKLLRWETRPSEATRGSAVLHTVHDGTAATTVGHSSLMGPGLAVLRKQAEQGNVDAAELLESGDRWKLSPQALLDAGKATDPRVLFSLGHGQGAPRAGWSSPGEQRREQGALSFGREGTLRAADLENGAFLPGGAWFMLACFGAGTPETSAYKHWLESLASVGQFRGRADSVLSNLPAAGERPFIAALPQAALANPDGPLSVFGHVDLAWTYSFQELDSGKVNRPARYMQLVRALLKRDRAGIALRELTRFLAHVDGELGALYDDEARGNAADIARRGHLWMLRQDLAGYVLLGDPAARLALAPKPSAASAATAPSLSDLLGFRPSGGSTPSATPTAAPSAAPSAAPDANLGPLPLPIETLEEAIGQVLVGERGAKAIAADYGIERAVLERFVEAYRGAGRRAVGG